MKIVSWNVNGLRAIVKKNFFETINLLTPDILCLQETKANNKETLEALLPLKDYYLYINSAEKKGYSGTALLCKQKPLKITYKLGIVAHDAEGRVICAEFPDFYLINVYVPNSGQNLVKLNYRKQWDVAFLNFLQQLQKRKEVIVCGDLNVAHQPIDLKNDKTNYNKTAGYTQIEIDGFKAILDAGFIDAFRFLNPTKVAYTYWSYRFSARAKNIGWRIDYFLITKSLINKMKSTEILMDIYGSDHCPIKITIKI